MVSPHVYFKEEKKIKDKRPQTAPEFRSCNANGGGKVVQRPLEKLRPPTTSKRLWPNHPDKESLLDELLELKNAIVEQSFHMKLHMQHAGEVQEDNDRLEKRVENLELAYGLEAPRVGGEGKLTSKLLGLKARLHEKQVICNSREVEIGLLRKDIRVTHCRELEIERDLFATEVGTLQKILRRLHHVFVCVNTENDEIQKVRQKINKLERINKDLKYNIEITKKNIVDSKSEIFALNRQSSEAKSATCSANSKLLELEAHSLILAKLKHQEEYETMKLEHSILKVGDDTRQILKDKISAEKTIIFAQQATTMANAHVLVKKKVRVLDQEPHSPNGDAMAQLEAKFLEQVEIAAVEFIEAVPALHPPSPKTEDQIQEQHTFFETRKGFFSDRVEEAEIKFLMAMEEIEYGQAKTKRGQSSAIMLAVAEKTRLRSEALAKKLIEDTKKAQEEVVRLQAELEKLKGMESRDKRWKNEKVNVVVGDKCLQSKDYRVQVIDKGVEISIDVDISQSSVSAMSNCTTSHEGLESARLKTQVEAKRLEEAMRNAQYEAKCLSYEMMKAQEERDKLATELKRLQGMEFGGKRWKSEVLDKSVQIDIDVQIQGISTKIENEVAAVKKNLLVDESNALIKTNIKEVLQHLENIAEVVKSKSSHIGPSKHDIDIGGHT